MPIITAIQWRTIMPHIEFITIERLLEMNANKEKFKLVEVLSEEEYKEGHIPGAINIPLEKLEKLAPKQLDKTDAIVVYCASYTCHASTKAAQELLDMGYTKTLDYKAGKRGWTHAGLELEK
jgi:rhodanese-related sulfurtransferase